jgi:hypothetical protein
MSDDVQQGRKSLLRRGYVFPSAERRVAESPIARTAVNTGRNEASGLFLESRFYMQAIGKHSIYRIDLQIRREVQQFVPSVTGDEKFTNFFQPPACARYTIAPLSAAGQGKPLTANLLP